MSRIGNRIITIPAGVTVEEADGIVTVKGPKGELKNTFRPEFLNRVDDIIYFNSLTEDNLKQIIKLEIGKFEKKLSEIGYSVEYDESVVNYIFNIVKDEKEYGARPIMRAIQDTIEDKITDALLAMDYENGHTFNISCTSDLSELAVA